MSVSSPSPASAPSQPTRLMMISQRTFLVLGLALASTIHFLVTSTNQSLCLYSVSNDSFSQQAVVNKDASQTYASTESFEGPYHIPTPYEKEVIARMVNYSFSRSQVIMTPANRSSFFKSDGDRCAFNFYGLPRSFLTMTLPSVIENILIPNANYDCHAFVYYHYIVEEAKGRSGDGGKINPDEILLLEEAMRQVGERIHGPGYQPVVRFRNFTEEHFWTVHAEILNKTRTTFDEEGHNVYMPKPDPSYNNVVVDNIIRMWHGQREVWRLMEETMQELHVNYTRVAMLRSDVLYSTRIHILDNGKGQIDYENRFAVLPGFARFPTNDRFIMGPYRGVKPWATQRFRLLDGHLLGNKRRGGFWWGIQSEQFVFHAILPAIERESVEISEDPGICFLRVRPHENMWTNEGCTNTTVDGNRKIVEQILNRKCFFRRPGPQARESTFNIYCDRHSTLIPGQPPIFTH